MLGGDKMKLSEIIKELEKDAGEREYLSKHGSPMSSIADDVTQGKIAENERKIIEKLKLVTLL